MQKFGAVTPCTHQCCSSGSTPDPSLPLVIHSGPAPDIWAAVLELAYPTIQNHARLFNASHSSTARLPPELLCAIFKLLPFEDKISTSHVCHAWREVSLRNPRQVWSDIPRTDCARTLSALLQRAGSCPVAIESVSLRNADSDKFRSLTAHLSHTRSLKLIFYGTPMPWSRNSPSDLLRVAAPMLEDLVLRDSTPGEHILRFDGTVVSHGAPLRGHVELHDIHCDFATAPLSRARSVIYHFEITNYNYPAEVLSSSLIRSVFSSCPRAELISLALPKADLLEQNNGPLHIRPAGLLKRLHISGASHGVPASLFSYIAHEDILEIAVWPRGTAQFTDLLSTLVIQQPAEHVDLHMHADRNAVHVRITDRCGRRRIFLDVGSHIFRDYAHIILAQITSLTISGTVRTVLPAMHLLRRLTVVAGKFVYEPPHLQNVIPPGAALRCRSLEVVSFALAKGGKAYPPAEQVLVFVRHSLVFELAKLRQIRFHGRVIKPYPEQSRAELLAVAETVVFHDAALDTEWRDDLTPRDQLRVD